MTPFSFLDVLMRSNNRSTMSRPDAFECLSNERRVYLIEVLRREHSTSIREVAEGRAEIEFGSNYNADERKAVYVAYYQVHLKRMRDWNIIEWEKNRGTIKRGENFDHISSVLGCVEKEFA